MQRIILSVLTLCRFNNSQNNILWNFLKSGMTGIGKNYSYYISSAATETGLSVEQVMVIMCVY